ncbi:MAG TPA: DNA mismatch repair endonuclease MutL [Syntrophales bacterium]|nr:DNA mismatch repair endonuclease MutL [Syntrophales bacterium]HON23554.1 DNA mismatch repair endonuclease MutL [Syntrophales bacterium]HOU78389.1 DNA mismatch repair endonuclease MutL [Syntrophales bacterium]HPC32746.1 DNA mismatch repair endonuclease MutL [Syntrophales bacterium]HQG35105.1 DNA mismatch repair endonuclease MutL [Syntrophales bacterium]
MSIRLLPPELTHQIAAGEVIERPASILKELLENSLDAGATVLQIEVVKGGCTSLRIIDNGTGMEPADVPLAFQRHATSKLSVFEDLYRLRTFGFRGEALPSIAAVARVEMTTRPAGALAGTMITVENGRIEEIREAGCPAGTAIFVSRIFDSVPVRRKFLKSETTEQGACLEAITRIALASPGVKIRVLSNGRPLWDFPATAAVGERIGMVLGQEIGRSLLKVKGVRENMELSGYITRPEVTRANAKSIYCFVNGRYIRDPLLNHAVMTACRNITEAKRYPAAVLFLTLPPEDVDVNVHPAKLEVRFRNPRLIYGLIVESLLAGLAAAAPPDSGTTAGASASGSPAAPAYERRIEEAWQRYPLYGGEKKTTYRPGASIFSKGGGLFSSRFDAGPEPSRRPGASTPQDAAAGRDEDAHLSGREDTFNRAAPAATTAAAGKDGPTVASARAGGDSLPPELAASEPDLSLPDGGSQKRNFREMNYLGQAGGTYLVFSREDELVLVDQHAAHERILYEELRRGSGEGKIAVQQLLLPEIVTLSPGDYGAMEEYRELLREAGLEIEPFGGHTIAIRSLPAMLAHLNPRRLLEEFMEQLPGETHPGSWRDKRERVLISLACQGAVKAGQVLSGPEVVRLCQDLDRLPFAGTCPHGRPVWIVLTARQLAGMFKRS